MFICSIGSSEWTTDVFRAATYRQGIALLSSFGQAPGGLPLQQVFDTIHIET